MPEELNFQQHRCENVRVARTPTDTYRPKHVAVVTIRTNAVSWKYTCACTLYTTLSTTLNSIYHHVSNCQQVMLCQHMPDHQPVRRDGHLIVSRCRTTLYGVSCHEPASRHSTLPSTSLWNSRIARTEWRTPSWTAVSVTWLKIYVRLYHLNQGFPNPGR